MTKLTAFQRQQVLQLYTEGISSKVIADKFGVGRAYPPLLAARAGLPKRNVPRSPGLHNRKEKEPWLTTKLSRSTFLLKHEQATFQHITEEIRKLMAQRRRIIFIANSRYQTERRRNIKQSNEQEAQVNG